MINIYFLRFLNIFNLNPKSKEKKRLELKARKILLKENNFPEVMGNKETINYIISNKISCARFGDGEFGYLLFENFEHFFQPWNKKLAERLKEILANKNKNCLVSIPLWMTGKEEIYLKSEFWTRCIIMYFKKIHSLLSSSYPPLSSLHTNKVYGSANSFGLLSFNEGNAELIKSLWNNRELVIITGKDSTFVYDDRIFDNSLTVDFLYTKPVDAWSEYDEILKTIKKKYSIEENKLFLLSLGLTATVLAYDLSLLGYQAIDIGHFTNYFLEFIDKVENIEVLRKLGKYVDGKSNILDIYNEKN